MIFNKNGEKNLETTSILYQNYWTAALEYWRDPAVRSWIIVSPASIGDTWCVCAMAKAFRETHGAPLALVLKESHLAIADMFPGDFERVISWEDSRLMAFCQRLLGQGAFAIDEPIIAHPYWHGLGRFYQPLIELLRHPGRGGLTLADHFRLILQLDWKTRLSEPVIPERWREEANAYADEIGMEPNNSVVLMPDSNTNPTLPDSFWEPLTRELVASGKMVFTNMAGNVSGPRSAPFPGSRPIHITIPSSIPLVERAGRLISMANGLQSLILGSRARAESTVLINDFAKGTRLPGPGFPIKDPISWQSFKYSGFCDDNVNEFAVSQDRITPQLVSDIARNAPSAMIKL